MPERRARHDRGGEIRDVDAYAEPLVYDVLHTPGTARELDVLERLEARWVTSRAAAASRRVWLEPACGSGRLVRLAAHRGRRSLGFDVSESMIVYARSTIARRGLAERARVFTARMESFVAGLHGERVVFAHSLINTVRHLPDDRAMLDHLAQMHAALRPGGVYVVGLHLSAYGVERASMDRFTARRGALTVTQRITYEPPEPGGRWETVRTRIEVRRPSGRQRLRARYALRCYSLTEWTALVEASPLRSVAVVDEAGAEAPAMEGEYRLFVLARSSSTERASNPSAPSRR